MSSPSRRNSRCPIRPTRTGRSWTRRARYLLQRLGIKGDEVNTSITLPAYVKDVAKVQIYCAWAEAVLGEASFSGTLTLVH